MVYAKVEGGKVTQVGLPTVGVVSLHTVSGFDLLPITILKTEGWLPLVENKPAYNSATQELKLTSYTVNQNDVTAIYEVVDKTAEPPTIDERLALLQNAIDFILTSF